MDVSFPTAIVCLNSYVLYVELEFVRELRLISHPLLLLLIYFTVCIAGKGETHYKMIIFFFFSFVRTCLCLIPLCVNAMLPNWCAC